MQNDLILKAAEGKPVERTPVWVMRQAGRILPEYRKVRGSVSGFIELVRTPELAAEVTLQPVDILGVDAAIIFSDILVIPEAMGLPYTMDEGAGPRFPEIVKNASDAARLHVAQSEDLRYVADAIALCKKELQGRVPIIGFAGAPWTLFCYMTEGKGSKTFSIPRRWLYTQPEASHQLLQKITEGTIAYLKMQVDAGAQMVQLFDSWAGVLPPELYREFSIRYLGIICEALSPVVPVTVFAKDARFAFEDFNRLNCRTIGLDWQAEPKKVRKILPGKTLQGNLDPCLLYASDEDIVNGTQNMLKAFAGGPHIANLGHGVYPDTDAQKVKLFIDTVKNFKL
jgi:uroporphyrinogen decarboxylase